MLIARLYMRVSTNEQDLARQHSLVARTKQQGFYIAGIYAEKISGATEWQERPELSRLIHDLQPNDVVIAESMDRLTRLAPTKALELINAIKSKGVKIQVPEVFDFRTLAEILHDTEDAIFNPNFLMSDIEVKQ